jgi:hypothetical protein
MKLTHKQRNAVTQILGYKLNDSQISDAVSICAEVSTEVLKSLLQTTLNRFRKCNGRNIEDGDLIGIYRIAIAVRKAS